MTKFYISALSLLLAGCVTAPLPSGDTYDRINEDETGDSARSQGDPAGGSRSRVTAASANPADQTATDCGATLRSGGIGRAGQQVFLSIVSGTAHIA
jgi:hypothetical protein